MPTIIPEQPKDTFRHEWLQSLSDPEFLVVFGPEYHDGDDSYGVGTCSCPNCKRYRRLTYERWAKTAAVVTEIRHHPNRLPEASEARKEIPIGTGLIDYFPNALAAIAFISKLGNDKHNPGEPLHWSRDKSNDHYDCAIRHLIDRGGMDKDGCRHTAMAAWRILALLEIEMEEALGLPPSRGST
jgi:hypothetical protein